MYERQGIQALAESAYNRIVAIEKKALVVESEKTKQIRNFAKE